LAKPIKTPVGWMILISFLAGSLQTSLNLYGLYLLPATLANLLLQLTAPFAIMISWTFRDERPTWKAASGCALALLGVAIVIGLPDDLGSWLGIGAITAGALIWAIAQNLIRHHGRDGGLSLYAALGRWSFPQMLLISLIFESNQMDRAREAGFEAWALIVSLSISGFAAGYALWYGLLSRNRIDHLLPFTLLVAPAGVLTSVALLGEPLRASLVIGGATILLGLAVINWRPMSPAS
jgi:O-acetylserine/cysteine efflux transporter